MQIPNRIFVRGFLIGVFLCLLLIRTIHSIESLSWLTASITSTNSPVKKNTEVETKSLASPNVLGCSNDNTASATSASPGAAQSDYTWVGDHWRPPVGIPLYSARDMQIIFSKEQTLWIGDSTSRQDYVTLYNMIMAATESNQNKDKSNSQANTLDDIAVTVLDHGINVNKQGKITEPCQKQIPNALDLLICRTIGNNHTTTTTTTTTTTKVNDGYNNYDYSEKKCWRDVVDFITTNQNIITRTYSTIIISVGLWDAVRFGYCGRHNETYIADVLDRVKNQFSSTNVQIFWKVHCGADNETAPQKERSAMIQQLTREWFGRQQSSKNYTNLHMVDLATVMEGRIYGPSRLSGDLPAHVGPLARTLFLQMATQAIEQNKQCTAKIS
jgi:hypothetical protein